MLPRGTTKLTAATFGAWIVFLALVGARIAGAPLPSGAVVAGAAVALAAAVAVACRTVTHAVRGPVVVDFRREQAVLCGPAEAEVVRAAALLRGTMGGAGYVSRAKLAFPAIASLAAALVAASALVDPTLRSAPVWPFAVLALSGGAAAAFPARPFYYREANGGALLLHPGDAWVHLARFSTGGAPATRPIDPRIRAAAPHETNGALATAGQGQVASRSVEAGPSRIGAAPQQGRES